MTDELKHALIPVRIAVLTVSDTRRPETDRSGDVLVERIASAGHVLASRVLVRDSVAEIETELRAWIDDPSVEVIVSTGGTGITGRDVTPEAFRRVLDKEMPGFGELFRMLSYQKIGVSAMQSRALAGVSGSTYVFALPGSPGAVADAWDSIISQQLDSRSEACTLRHLRPRLRER